MGNPPNDKTTINVKAVPVKSWERAKSCAAKQDEAMGEWLHRAINQLADMEAGPREFPPVKPEANKISEAGNPGQSTMTPGELAGLLGGIAAAAAACGVPAARADLRRAYGLADDMVRDARGIPRKPRPSGKALRQSSLLSGKSTPLIEGPAQPTPTPTLAPAEAEAADVKATPGEMRQVRRAARRGAK